MAHDSIFDLKEAVKKARTALKEAQVEGDAHKIALALIDVNTAQMRLDVATNYLKKGKK